MDNKKYKIIIGVLVVLLVVALGVICLLVTKNNEKEETRKKGTEIKEAEKVIIREYEEPEIKEILYNTTSYGNDDVEIVELTNDGTVLVTINGTEEDVTRKEVANNVVDTYIVKVSQSDTCEGNKRIIFVGEDRTATYLNIDSLVCGHEIEVEPLEGVKNIDYFDTKVVKQEGEPDYNLVYVITKDGNKKDITNFLN